MPRQGECPKVIGRKSPPEALRRLLRRYLAGGRSSDADRMFDWAERTYPRSFLSKNPLTGHAQGYVDRHHVATDEFLGVKEGKVWCHKPGATAAPVDVGTVRHDLGIAQQAGY